MKKNKKLISKGYYLVNNIKEWYDIMNRITHLTGNLTIEIRNDMKDNK